MATVGNLATRGSKPLLSWRDFLLPELVGRADNGDPSVKAVSSAEQEQQTLHLLGMSPAIQSSIDEEREKKLYIQWLKQDVSRVADLGPFLQREIDAEQKFQQWLTQKLSRKLRALERKANRLFVAQ